MRFIFSLLLLYSFTVKAQTWENYTTKSSYGKETHIKARVDLSNEVPVKDYETVLVTGLRKINTYETKLVDFFEYKLHQFIKKHDAIHIGKTTTKREEFHYFYLKKGKNLKKELKQYYNSNFKNIRFTIRLLNDPEWNVYFSTIYPSVEDLHLINNKKMVQQLIDEGDNVKTERKVTHYASFASKNVVSYLKAMLSSEGYTIDTTSTNKELKLPYALVFSKKSAVDLTSINKETLFIISLINKFEGTYNGWETDLIN